ncbi:NF038120 family PEP-CTERM protein [Pelomonas sp. SE-A7]|uniref:NF038120 family PEP-CTERM protein n=1 Tax=Pelomonas sp. SE-A7 TaxID=3054953 RepID=UPI00259CD926|nr:NF038120 family PEP-CTERM protein [Pelomonas sp. SE-A7]MDM4767014.1 NF038120 family PEP-CTERM protein [Pelomonas sp. SE-A7]
MRSISKSALALAAACLFGSAAAAPTTTYGIEFEGSDVSLRSFGAKQGFAEGRFAFTATDPWNGQGLVGAGISGASNCEYMICPSRGSSYYGVFNDGGLLMEGRDGQSFQLSGFAAAFIAPAFDYSLVGQVGRLLVAGTTADGLFNQSFELQGLREDGRSAFANYSFDAAFQQLQLSSVHFSACIYDENHGCANDASYNLAQFGLDSIQVVPEPGSLALLGLGLGAVVFSNKRRPRVQA